MLASLGQPETGLRFPSGQSVGLGMHMTSVSRLLLTAVLALGSAFALADSWMPPSVETTDSANGRSRVTIVPRGIKSPLAFFEDKVAGKEPAGQREGDSKNSPIARVEQLDAAGRWQLLWQKPLVNDVGPTEALLADNASYLVTFDNWHSVGFGEDVVVIYDRHGNLVRKLGLNQILPPSYVAHLPRSVSSRWWRKGIRLVERDTQVEIQVVEPGSAGESNAKFVPVRLDLANGSVLPGGKEWIKAMAHADRLESERQAAWEKVRVERIAPLFAPRNNDTHAWRHYMMEIRDRIKKEKEMMGGMVLAAPGAEKGFHDAKSIAGWIDGYDSTQSYGFDSFVFSSPTSDRLATILAKSLRARRPGSMRGARIAFVGTPAEGVAVADAAAKAGAEFILIDRTQPVPPGKALPATPPELWQDMSATF
jgi:hypothetical protein